MGKYRTALQLLLNQLLCNRPSTPLQLLFKYSSAAVQLLNDKTSVNRALSPDSWSPKGPAPDPKVASTSPTPELAKHHHLLKLNAKPQLLDDS